MRNGYKVSYKEKGFRGYERHFKAYTKRQAAIAKRNYMRYPPLSRDDGHVLKQPRWKVVRISRREIKAGIWREVPF